MRPLVLIIISFFVCFNSTAQKQNNNWCFGEAGGVSFNNGTPTSFKSVLSTNEGVATVSSSTTGGLLFYSSTADLYNRNYTVMPNGADISIDTFSTSAQGVNIVPFINDTNKYYVFTLTAEGTSGRLSYSVVDMTLDGGLGDVVAGQKNIPIDSGYTESMVVTESCENYWLITYKRNTADFHAYRITASGINMVPVISTPSYAHRPRAIATMKVSPDGQKLCATVINGNLGSYVALHNFNKVSGVVSNGRIIDTENLDEFYGCEFSPDSKLLYVSGEKSKSVYQYDISKATTAAITASRQIVHISLYPMGVLQMAPDSNIYVSIGGIVQLANISNANAVYPNCVFTSNAVSLSSGSFTKLGLPQAVVSPINTSLNNSTLTQTDTVVCLEKDVVLYGRTGYEVYEWQDGSAADSFVVSKEGRYWVHSTKACLNVIDTIVVAALDLNVFVGDDTTICIGDELTLRSNPQPSGTSFLWSNGSTGDTMVIGQSGRYNLRIDYKGCSDTDEVIVTHYPRINIELGNDTQICKGNAFTLPQIESSDFDAKYRWQDGSMARTFDVTQAGKYRVELSNQCQTIIDSITVTGRNCHFFFPSAFSPNGDGRNDIARLVGDVGAVKDFSLSIFNRWGEVVYTTDNPIEGWKGYYKNQKAGLGVYYYQIQYTYLGEKELMKGDLILFK